MIHPNEKQRRAVYHLWDELADFPASQADAALRCLMGRVGEWLRADNMVWVGAARIGHGAAARRDIQLGWRGLQVTHWQISPRLMELSRLAMVTQESDPGMTTTALAARAGEWRVHRLRDKWINFKAFERTQHYDVLYRKMDISDRIFAGVPVNADSESFLLADRYGDAPRFTASDVGLMAFAMRGLKWFHRELLLVNGILLAEQPLSPTERRILRLLLTEMSEQQIAGKMGQTLATTHKYITGIFRKYNVRGRMGLMARWLNRMGDDSL